jgi:nucleotide-binding universal stress UspA family protein
LSERKLGPGERSVRRGRGLMESHKLVPMNAIDGPVLIAFDGSGPARQAMTDAAKLLGPHKTIVVTVWEPKLAYMTTAAPPDLAMSPVVEPEAVLGVEQALRENAERVARQGAELARTFGLDAEPLAVSSDGDVAHTLVNLANQHEASAIVVGSRGLGGIRARLEGSTSKGVLKRAHCPVLVVHEEEA